MYPIRPTLQVTLLPDCQHTVIFANIAGLRTNALLPFPPSPPKGATCPPAAPTWQPRELQAYGWRAAHVAQPVGQEDAVARRLYRPVRQAAGVLYKQGAWVHVHLWQRRLHGKLFCCMPFTSTADATHQQLQQK